MRYIIGRSLEDLCRALFGVRYCRAEAPAEGKSNAATSKNRVWDLMRDYGAELRYGRIFANGITKSTGPWFGA